MANSSPPQPEWAQNLNGAGLSDLGTRWTTAAGSDAGGPSFEFSTARGDLWEGVLAFTDVVGWGICEVVPAPAESWNGPRSYATLDANMTGNLVLGSAPDQTELAAVGHLSADASRLELNLRASFAEGYGLGSLLQTVLAPFGLDIVPANLVNHAVSNAAAELTVERTGCPDLSNLLDGSAPLVWSTTWRLELSFGIGGQQAEWEVVPGLLTLRAPGCMLVVEGGAGGATATLHLQERFTLFGATWILEIQVPSLSGSLTLAPAEPLTLGGLLAHFGLHDVGGLGKVGIASASVSIAGDDGLVQFDLTFSDATLDLGVVGALSLVSIGVGYATGADGGVTADLHVQATVAGMSLDLVATHPGPGLGWQFSGGAAPGALAGATLEALAADLDLGELPPALASAKLTDLQVSHDTAAGTWHLEIGATIESAALTVVADKSVNGADASWQLSGSLHIGTTDLEIRFVKVKNGEQLESLVLVSLDTTGAGVTLSDLMAPLGLGGVTMPVSFSARRVLALIDKVADGEAGSSSRRLFAADLALGMDFSGLRKLPFLGAHLPANATVSAALSPVYAKGFSGALPPAEIVGYLPATLPTLPSTMDSTSSVTFTAQVMVGGHRFTLPTDAPPTAQDPAPGPAQPPAAPSSTLPAPTGLAAQIAWHDVGVTLGGFIQIRRIGTAFHSPQLTLLVDGSVGLSSLTLELLGLGLNYDIRTHDTSFAFLGMGFSFERGPLGVSAAFMNMDGDFVGTAAVRTETFALTALGGFAEVGGAASVFLYGVLNAEIGGPPFFFVEGLAGGFGINRHLTSPEIAQVSQFPFVVAAMGQAAPPALGASPTDTLETELASLHAYVAPSLGEMFFAAGVKFNSFHLIDGFLLAIVAIDARHATFSVDVLGEATLQVPPAPEPVPLVFVKLDLLASFRPAEGVLMVQAALDATSYVIVPACHLTGGLAAGFWFSGAHAGDFVVSVGGYHPHFKVPAHYPVPARLGVDWQISDCVHATGSMYYALTPQALMLGFGFSLTWHSGPLKAWFDAGLDFLMEFHPPHFDGRGYIEIGASFDTFLGNITISAGAELHIWGPPFAGEAWAHLGPFHAHVSFGSSPGPKPLSWADFQKHLLPQPDKGSTALPWLSTTVASGFVRECDSQGDGASIRWTQVRAKELALTVESVVPVSGLSWATALPAALAIRPCSVDGQADRTWGATLAVSVTEDGQDVTSLFALTPTSKRFPSALWASRTHVDTLIEASAGFAITPAQPPVEGASLSIRRSVLAYDDRLVCVGPPEAGARLFPPCFPRTDDQRSADRATLQSSFPSATVPAAPTPTTTARRAVLAALADKLGCPTLAPGLSDRVGPATPAAWLYAPHITTVSNV